MIRLKFLIAKRLTDIVRSGRPDNKNKVRVYLRPSAVKNIVDLCG